MSGSFKVAAIQMTSSPDIDENLDKAEGFVRQAAGNGANFILTPENTCSIRYPINNDLDGGFSIDTHPAIPHFSALSKELSITLVIGSISVNLENEGKRHNRSIVFSPEGKIKAIYNKIHLFDVQIPNGESHKESNSVKAGEEAVVVNVNDNFSAGLSICYDLRFPHLYRDLVKSGANIICAPAAFTVATGKAHWEVLLRARAIETGSYVIAAAQTGEHEGGRKTYGHSMIIDPWGRILAQKEDGEGIIYANLEKEKISRARNIIPALTHDRDYKVKFYE